jgi:ketosteroid isomerase-like protein
MSTATLNSPALTDEAAILAVLDNLSEAHFKKNTSLFAEQFAPAAAIFNLAPPLSHHGVNRSEKQAWFDSWATPITIEPRDFKVNISGDLAFAYGYLHLAGTKKGTESAVSFWMRETLCLQRQGSGEWQIVHEHASVPFYMDGTLRPAFDLQPEQN